MICVPTPFHKNGNTPQPNIEFVISATQSIAPFVKSGDLIILESTSPVGTTKKIQEILIDGSVNLTDVHISYCPERVLPGKIMTELVENDRIIGGLTSESTKKAVDFYRSFVNGNILETDANTAEMCKLAENSYRDLNIAFANELSMICDKQEINVWDLIKLANKHPRVNILQPGTGVGGHCISVDPWFIISQDTKNTKLIRSAREVNDYKTKWVIEKIKNKVIDRVSTSLDKVIENRTIPELNPKLGSLGTKQILNAAKTTKNKNIIKNVGANLDSPGISFTGRYGTSKVSPNTLEDIQDALQTQKPKFTTEGKTLMNPIEARETGAYLPTTFKIGTEAKPFFVSPKKLANKLDKSNEGGDFFKLRTTEKDYLTDLETAIKTEGYKPNPIQIQIQPTGNATVYEGNHRLYRALTKGDKEVPVTFMYTAGAERLNVPFGIKQLETFVAEGAKGYKTEKEYLKYIDEVNKSYKK